MRRLGHAFLMEPYEAHKTHAHRIQKRHPLRLVRKRRSDERAQRALTANAVHIHVIGVREKRCQLGMLVLEGSGHAQPPRGA